MIFSTVPSASEHGPGSLHGEKDGNLRVFKLGAVQSLFLPPRIRVEPMINIPCQIFSEAVVFLTGSP